MICVPPQMKSWKQETKINNLKTQIDEGNQRMKSRYSTCTGRKGTQLWLAGCYVFSDGYIQ